jgi:hypothetical protein
LGDELFVSDLHRMSAEHQQSRICKLIDQRSSIAVVLMELPGPARRAGSFAKIDQANKH